MRGWLATFRRSWAQPHIRWLAAILLVALVLRVLWVAAVQPDPREGRLDDTGAVAALRRLPEREAA